MISSSKTSDSDNYYDRYRKSMKSNRFTGWLILTVVAGSLLFWGGITLYNNNPLIGNLWDSHSKDRKEVKMQIEKTYWGIANGAFTSQTIGGTGVNALPFYNLDLKDLIPMGMMPMANILGVKIQMEAKNIVVSDFINESTAVVSYKVFVITNNKIDTLKVENMKVKKIGDSWKLDGEKAFGKKHKQ